MSRIGQNPVPVPEGVTVEIAGNTFKAKGKLGELSMDFIDEVEVKIENDNVVVSPKTKSRLARNMWGTTRSQLQNLIKGVEEGFTINLEIIGVGYRAAVSGQSLTLQLGFSHEVDFPIPEGITVKCAKPTNISIFGSDKHLVGQVAANIRALKKPEPYKGKGIRYENEAVLRKEGKKK